MKQEEVIAVLTDTSKYAKQLMEDGSVLSSGTGTVDIRIACILCGITAALDECIQLVNGTREFEFVTGSQADRVWPILFEGAALAISRGCTDD